MSEPRPSSRAGFTLLEVVIAMVALALVAGICYGAFHLGIRAVERGEVAVVTAQRLRAATDVLIRQIKSAVPYAARNADEDVYPYFVGTPTSLSFITAAGQLGGGGLARVTYRLEDDPPRLVLEESADFGPDSLGRGTPDAVAAPTSVVLDGFRTLAFQYCLLEDDEEDAKCDWQNTWDGLTEEFMPAAVRVLVEGLPGIEEDVWGQEIPLMAPAYGEANGEVDEEQIAECDTGEETGSAAPTAGGMDTRDPTAGKDEDEEDDDDEDADDE